jgi:hypothetical protein
VAAGAVAVAIGVGALAIGRLDRTGTIEDPASAQVDSSDPRIELVDGRRVRLDRATVTGVVGDTAFWVAGRGRILVVIDEARQAEQAVTVRDGQIVRVSGVARRSPSQDMVLSTEDRRAVDSVALFILAEHVDVLEDP